MTRRDRLGYVTKWKVDIGVGLEGIQFVRNSTASRCDPGTGRSEHYNEALGSVHGATILWQLSSYLLSGARYTLRKTNILQYGTSCTALLTCYLLVPLTTLVPNHPKTEKREF
jgi:hypothetical protein